VNVLGFIKKSIRPNAINMLICVYLGSVQHYIVIWYSQLYWDV